MSELAKEQLQELTDLINARLAEFENSLMPTLTPGIVRTSHDVIKKWYEEKEESWAMQRISEVTITAEMAMKLSKQGYDMGLEAAKRKMAAAQPSHVETVKGPTGAVSAAVTDEPPMFPYRHPDWDKPPLASVARIVKREPTPEEVAYGIELERELTANGNGIAAEETPQPVLETIDAINRHNGVPGWRPGEEYGVNLSEQATATLGPEHVVVPALVPRRPRTLEEVDADEAAAKLRQSPPDRKADRLREIIHELQDLAVEDVMPTILLWDSARPPHLPKAQAIVKGYELSWSQLAEYAKLKYQGKSGPRQKHAVLSSASLGDADGHGDPD